MPNWTDVRVSVTHKDKFVMDRLEEILDRGEPFDQIIPMPLALRDTVSPDPKPDSPNYKGEQPVVDGHTNWYDWSVANWGTKWDVPQGDIVLDRIDDHTMDFTLQTAWSPPIPVFDYLVNEYEYSIHAVYLDEGHMYVGEYIDGDEENYDTSTAPDHLKDEFNLWEHIYE